MAIMTLGNVAQYINGRAFKPEEWEEHGKPIIRIQNLTNSSAICNRTEKTFEGKYLVTDGDLLFAWSASLGAHIWHGEDGWLNQHIFKVIPDRCIEKMYLYYFLLYVVDQLYAKAHGSGMVHITLKPFKETPITVPALKTQKRIVDLIESLFADLDAAKEKLSKVLDGFAERKAALLHQALTGELTAEWRNEHNYSMEMWSQKKLGDTGILERGKSKHRPRNDPKLFDGPYPFVQTGDIAAAEMFVTSHKQTLSEVGLQQSRLFPAGTLCITIAANIGAVAILSYDCCFPDSVVGFTPGAGIMPEYVFYLLTTMQSELEANAPATAQKNINLKVLNNIKINVPPMNEQKEILRLLDEVFNKEKRAQVAVEEVLMDIGTLKKSILARAFRGELGMGNPTDETATELLRRVL